MIFRSLITASLFLSLLTVGSCSGSSTEKTKNKDDSETSQSSGDGASVKTEKHRETFKVDSMETKQFFRPLHIIWVVDNSEAMEDDIIAFTTAIKLISGALKTLSQVKITVITKLDNWHIKAGNRSVPAQVLQQVAIHPVNHEVKAKEPLRVLANYLSEKATQIGGDFYLPLTPPLGERIGTHPQHSTFFNDPEALKAFVIMTNTAAYGNEAEPESSAFMSLLKDIYSDNLKLLRFYAFINMKLTDPLPNTDNNAAFKALAQELGGKTWNVKGITPAKWKEVFLAAQTHITSAIQLDSDSEQKAAFSLENTVSKILEVKVNNAALSTSSFHTTGKTIYINTSDIKSGDTLEVNYESSKAS